MRARHRASQHLPSQASHGLKRRIPSPAEKRRPPTLSNPEQSRPGVQGSIPALLPLSGNRLARFTPGRTRCDRRCIAIIIITRAGSDGGNAGKAKGDSARSHLGGGAYHQRCIASFGNDPSAGSPTETLLRLLLPLNDHAWALSRQAHLSDHSEEQLSRQMPVQIPRKIVRSVVATGGVYKGQGRNRRELMTRAYWEFLVQGR